MQFVRAASAVALSSFIYFLCVEGVTHLVAVQNAEWNKDRPSMFYKGGTCDLTGVIAEQAVKALIISVGCLGSPKAIAEVQLCFLHLPH